MPCHERVMWAERTLRRGPELQSESTYPIFDSPPPPPPPSPAAQRINAAQALTALDSGVIFIRFLKPTEHVGASVLLADQLASRRGTYFLAWGAVAPTALRRQPTPCPARWTLIPRSAGLACAVCLAVFSACLAAVERGCLGLGGYRPSHCIAAGLPPWRQRPP